MVVISRHKDESITLETPDGKLVVVSVVEIRGDKVRLSIDTDPPSDLRELSVHRKEVLEAIKRTNFPR
ncbi:MAG: carbon storage regulator [Pirellulaceae bacterium]|nr:carbon storage regulator [Pirellulaceae bacterium]